MNPSIPARDFASLNETARRIGRSVAARPHRKNHGSDPREDVRVQMNIVLSREGIIEDSATWAEAQAEAQAAYDEAVE